MSQLTNFWMPFFLLLSSQHPFSYPSNSIADFANAPKDANRI